jgi:hypothetical protein
MKFLYPGGGDVGQTTYGIITAPNHKGIPLGIVQGLPWAGDLGALIGPDYVKRIDFEAVAKWLPTMRQYKPRCLFLAGGDVVGNALDTLETYTEFEHYFDGWPLAYVAQNGAEYLPIPATCAAVFIGGDTAWKLSDAAAGVIERAVKLGKHIHIGRVNWIRRYMHFRQLPGSDGFTCDGTRPRYDGRDKTLAAWGEYEDQTYQPLLFYPGG